MAPSPPIGPLVDQLVTSLVPLNTTATKLRRLRDQTSRKLRHHNYARTNQFEVAEKLSGLEEKFQVLNNDELGRALHIRLVELKRQTEQWLPDALDLLLQLSDHPVTKSNLEHIYPNPHATTSSPPLTWAQVEFDDPFDHNDQIWQTQSLSSLSSDEDEIAVSSEPPSPTSFKEILGEPRPRFGGAVDDQFETFNADDLSAAQFWGKQSGGEIYINELQAIRETLFMLRGLPTSLFRNEKSPPEVNKKFRLDHFSSPSFWAILESFGEIYANIALIRAYSRRAQTIPFLQTLRSGLEEDIFEFDMHVSMIEMEHLAPSQETVVSLVKVRDSITTASKGIVQLAAFVQQAEVKAFEPIQRLECLFEMTCLCDSSGDHDAFPKLLHLFLMTFKTYLRPVIRWLEIGELDATQKSFFISTSDSCHELSSMWHNRFTSDALKAPNFLQSVVNQIFLVGKTTFFLRQLQGAGSHEKTVVEISFLDELQLSSASDLLPFSNAFESAMATAIDKPLRSVSNCLRQELNHQCGLWRSLEALHMLYLGKDGFLADLFDTKIFDCIDREKRTWNDRFLLRELLHSVFCQVESIDTERIILQSGHGSSRDMQSRRQSVHILGDLQIDYVLPWPVANILSKSAMARYRRISTFLRQIRRARYVLERRSHVQVKTEKLGGDRDAQVLAQGLHHTLLLFVNCIYDHLTSFAIETMIRQLKESFALNMDIDKMISAHEVSIASLEETCLTSKKLTLIREAVLIALDLCIRFSDTVIAPQARRSSDVEIHSFISAASEHGKYSRRRKDDDTFSSEDLDDDDDGEGYSTFINPNNLSYVDELRNIKSQFHQQLAFIVAGLRSIGRFGEQSTSWEILAERLDWRKTLVYT